MKILDKMSNPLKIILQRRSLLYKNEDIGTLNLIKIISISSYKGYVGAFLASIRNKLLPYHSKSIKDYPTKGICISSYKHSKMK